MSRGSTWAVVPVKALNDAKQRLAAVLPLEARRRLMLTTLEDVLAALRPVEAITSVLVVTPDAEAAEVARRHAALVLREPRAAGHSAAASAGFAEARAHGATRALTIPADAPLVTPDELRALLNRAPTSPSPRLRGEGRHRAPTEPASAPQPNPLPTEEWGEGTAPCVTLVPSRDGDGTNAILVSPPDAFMPSFGPGSFVRHLAQAAADGIPCRSLPLTGLGLDIDEPSDLRELISATRGNPRYAFLARYALEPAGAVEP
jgi:2-phospho-L-lactate/phosphoenolpyruvate guanylyltransferase